MKKATYALLMLGFILLMTACESDPRRAFVRRYLKTYPEATLIDIFKGTFQDQFGSSHMIVNKEPLARYIKEEMDSVQDFRNPDYFPCGFRERYYQVNLRVVADGRVPFDVFVDAFYDGGRGLNLELTYLFVDNWRQTLKAIKEVAPKKIDNFTEESLFLEKLMGEGKYIVHHTDKFNKLYRPHYRIIRRDLFEERILPYLK